MLRMKAVRSHWQALDVNRLSVQTNGVNKILQDVLDIDSMFLMALYYYVFTVQASSALLTLQEANMKPGRVIATPGKQTPHKNLQTPVSKKPSK